QSISDAYGRRRKHEELPPTRGEQIVRVGKHERRQKRPVSPLTQWQWRPRQQQQWKTESGKCTASAKVHLQPRHGVIGGSRVAVAMPFADHLEVYLYWARSLF